MEKYMIIQSSEVNMSSTHEKSETRTSSSNSILNMGSFEESGDYSGLKHSSNSDQFQALIDQFTTLTKSLEQTTTETPEENNNSILVMTKDGFKFRTAEENTDITDQSLLTSIKMFKQLLEAISSQFNKTNLEQGSSVDDISDIANPSATGETTGLNDNGTLMPGSGIMIEMSFKQTETVEQHEKTQFNSVGSVTTADGKNIDFDLSMTMERDYSYTSTSEFTQSVLFKDPIVINYPGTSAELSDEKFAFDIDADGNEDMISYFNNGAMLALDKNNDGTINDGSELFGALSGNGFADLAAYDEDGNNYIDEADSIFKDLKLWTKTADDDSLTSLKSMDVGAIYLGAQETPFDIKGDDNQFNGQVKSSSFYLTDAGEVGSVQQIDMVV
jgi:hypothetical protein